MITMLVNCALKGDPKAWNSLLSLMRAVRLADEAPDDD